MADVQAQREQLRQAMAVLEAQRATLGDGVVDPALTGLRQQLTALEAQLPAEPTPPEQRRVITILFTDIVGSTVLAEKLDPEEWRHTVAEVHATAGRILGGGPPSHLTSRRPSGDGSTGGCAKSRSSG